MEKEEYTLQDLAEAKNDQEYIKIKKKLDEKKLRDAQTKINENRVVEREGSQLRLTIG